MEICQASSLLNSNNLVTTVTKAKHTISNYLFHLNDFIQISRWFYHFELNYSKTKYDLRSHYTAY